MISRSFFPYGKVLLSFALLIWSSDLLRLEADEIERPNIAELAEQHSGLDLNGDQHPEINRLEVLESISPATREPGMLVLVEQRLLELDRQLSPAGQLLDQLKSYGQALEQDGLSPIFVSADLEKSERHQDGLTLLALRRFFQQVHQRYPQFQGAVLIGSFPESMLVRRWAWLHKDRQVRFGDVTYNKGKGPRATYLAFDPELISHRSDVVLADLNGRWEELYVQEKTTIDCIKLIPDDPQVFDEFKNQKVRFHARRYSIQPKAFEDCFVIDDAVLNIVDRNDDGLTLETSYQLSRPEIPADDPECMNPQALPEILVSRINPLHVAALPPESALSAAGVPQSVSSDINPNQFTRSPKMERELLVAYLQRNLQHRRGRRAAEQNRAALLTTDIRTFDSRYLQRMSDQFSDTVEFHRADAVAFARFVKTPAVLKGISAHSSPNTSILIPGYKPEDLDRETGGYYWRWQKLDQQYVPSYRERNVCNRVDTSLLRTLWHNGQLDQTGPCFYIHGGCEAMSPNRAGNLPYHDVGYGGHTQIAESLLFFGNGLALIGRAKVFYDCPTNPHRYFHRSQGRFGEILRGYIQEESDHFKAGVAGRNRSYFWSIIGDWTLRLDYPQPTETETGT